MIANLEKIIRTIEADAKVASQVNYRKICEIDFRTQKYPIYSFNLGTSEPKAPTLLVTGGVHGLERIGAQLAWSLLKSTIDRLAWDKSLQDILKTVKLVFVPLLNPVGFVHLMRSNGNGVDLMRNSPVRSSEKVPFLVGGQTYSNLLPWYHGDINRPEAETQALYDLFFSEIIESKNVISLDFHSGFGLRDRLWFPYSYKKEAFENLPEIYSLTTLLKEAHPYHIYQIEPQSSGYLLNGDLWDHLYLEYRKANADAGVFLPITLEMGSWTWVRKNPIQIFSKQGAFNPIKEHRLKRTFRRHHLLFEFMIKALYSSESWASIEADEREDYRRKARLEWY